MSRKISAMAERTLEQIKEQYQIEKDLAARLRQASKEERRRLYTQVLARWFAIKPLLGKLHAVK